MLKCALTNDFKYYPELRININENPLDITSICSTRFNIHSI